MNLAKFDQAARGTLLVAVSPSVPTALRLFGPLVFDAPHHQRKQHQSRIVAVDFVRSAELCRFTGGGEVRPQALEPLVADDVGRAIDTRSAFPLPVGVSCLGQAGSPALQ